MKQSLYEVAQDHRIITAHRGVSGGNIPCNTIASYEIALMQEADMVEIDVDMTADGVLVIFHPGMEKRQLGIDTKIPEMPFTEVAQLRYKNFDRTLTQFPLPSLEEFLTRFQGRCFINVDKFWGHPVEIYQMIKRFGVLDQVVVKSKLSESVLKVLEEVAPDVPFMPVVFDTFPQHEDLMRRNIRYVGVEMNFTDDTVEVAQPETIEKLHRDGKLVWVNSIVFDYKKQVAGGHSDDVALTESMETGWGWHAERNYDIIQTDWPAMLIRYLKETGRYYRHSGVEGKRI